MHNGGEYLRLGLNCQRYAIGKEHAPTTGITHYHSLAIFAKKLDSKNVRIFDIQDVHPNIVVPRRGK